MHLALGTARAICSFESPRLLRPFERRESPISVALSRQKGSLSRLGWRQ